METKLFDPRTTDNWKIKLTATELHNFITELDRACKGSPKQQAIDEMTRVLYKLEEKEMYLICGQFNRLINHFKRTNEYTTDLLEDIALNPIKQL